MSSQLASQTLKVHVTLLLHVTQNGSIQLGHTHVCFTQTLFQILAHTKFWPCLLLNWLWPNDFAIGAPKTQTISYIPNKNCCGFTPQDHQWACCMWRNILKSMLLKTVWKWELTQAIHKWLSEFQIPAGRLSQLSFDNFQSSEHIRRLLRWEGVSPGDRKIRINYLLRCW